MQDNRAGEGGRGWATLRLPHGDYWGSMLAMPKAPSLILLTTWNLWKHRNGCVFDGLQPSMYYLLQLIMGGALAFWQPSGVSSLFFPSSVWLGGVSLVAAPPSVPKWCSAQLPVPASRRPWCWFLWSLSAPGPDPTSPQHVVCVCLFLLRLGLRHHNLVSRIWNFTLELIREPFSITVRYSRQSPRLRAPIGLGHRILPLRRWVSPIAPLLPICTRICLPSPTPPTAASNVTKDNCQIPAHQGRTKSISRHGEPAMSGVFASQAKEINVIKVMLGFW